MKDQILKAFTMITVIAVLGLVTTVVLANGQSQSLLKADIPFAFTIGDKTLEPGEYTVESIFAGGQGLRIRSRVPNASMMRLTNSIETSKTPQYGKLVFRRYGEHYFLAEVWRQGDRFGLELVKSRRERAIERERGQLAQSTFERVELVAKLR